MIPKTLRRLIAAALFALSTVPGQAAEQFPARQITLVVPLTPGTTIDILARLYADKLGKLLGQQIVVMNRPGAGGIVGAESISTATWRDWRRWSTASRRSSKPMPPAR
ncbi:MAG TPA: tripartite tricarboxylate transporter substrate-binding protein [Xanthobacteraceae bacterium]|jgi:tripartite-type tricarboxylate transporter receptor subunit TctC|nr:tripartite tricarboxylate transporter substrate-binding protein [Xanthobacteraceae bacterium]